jgi:hypothetical protein
MQLLWTQSKTCCDERWRAVRSGFGESDRRRVLGVLYGAAYTHSNHYHPQVIEEEMMAESKENQPTGDSAPIKKAVQRDAAAEAAKPQPAVASERELAR